MPHGCPPRAGLAAGGGPVAGPPGRLRDRGRPAADPKAGGAQQAQDQDVLRPERLAPGRRQLAIEQDLAVHARRPHLVGRERDLTAAQGGAHALPAAPEDHPAHGTAGIRLNDGQMMPGQPRRTRRPGLEPQVPDAAVTRLAHDVQFLRGALHHRQRGRKGADQRPAPDAEGAERQGAEAGKEGAQRVVADLAVGLQRGSPPFRTWVILPLIGYISSRQTWRLRRARPGRGPAPHACPEPRPRAARAAPAAPGGRRLRDASRRYAFRGGRRGSERMTRSRSGRVLQ